MASRALPVVALLIAGCASAPDTYDQPARIVDPTDGSRAALRATLAEVLGVPVTISDSALTDSSVLVLESLPPANMENPVPLGRVMEMPIQFRLVKNGDDCFLVNQQDRKRYRLTETTCQPE